MKQIIQSYKTGIMTVQEVPAPALQPGGAIVRTTKSVVSPGTEKMVMDLSKASLLGKARKRPDLVRKVVGKLRQEGVASTFRKVQTALDKPVPLGYSCAGIVEELGQKCPGFSVGERIACGGAGYANHAEFNFVPRNLCVGIPENVTDEQAAYVTIGAIAVQGVRQCGVSVGDRVVVSGLGLIGIIAVQILKASGAFVIGYDPNEYRCEFSSRLCADISMSDTASLIPAVMDSTEGHGVDAVLICASTTSNQPIEMAGEIARMRGTVVALGAVRMDVPRNLYYKKELELKLSMAYGPGRYDPSYEERGLDYPYPFVRWTENRNMSAFLELVAKGKIQPEELTTHRFKLDEAQKAYGVITAATPSRCVLYRPVRML